MQCRSFGVCPVAARRHLCLAELPHPLSAPSHCVPPWAACRILEDPRRAALPPSLKRSTHMEARSGHCINGSAACFRRSCRPFYCRHPDPDRGSCSLYAFFRSSGVVDSPFIFHTSMHDRRCTSSKTLEQDGAKCRRHTRWNGCRQLPRIPIRFKYQQKPSRPWTKSAYKSW